MKKTVRAAVLGVGSELTSGQIGNSNALWISQRLKAMGLLTSTHLVVPDDKSLILDGLEFCAQKSDLIFVTGGLGPTSDDFTRDLISQWSKLDLEFDPATWDHIVERLRFRGIATEEFQKQQCYFPKRSTILKNTLGTAHGFYLHANHKDIFVLPGPPREIEAIWKDHVFPWLVNFTEKIDRHVTLSWDILGKSEGELARITEDILRGSGLEIGYRVHMPYVEIKVSFFQSERSQFENFISMLDQSLSALTVSRQGEDIVNLFCEKLKNYDSIHFLDEITSGYLVQRLQTSFRNQGLWKNKKISFSTARGSFLEDTSLRHGIIFKLIAGDSLKAKAQWHSNDKHGESVFSSPYPQAAMEERRNQYFAEQALIFWSKSL